MRSIPTNLQKCPINSLSKTSILQVNRGNKSLYSTVRTAAGDRLNLPSSEPTATISSKKQGFSHKINWETPTTVAPIFRAAFAGGGVDSVPTVTPMTASQSRLATTMVRRRMLRQAGKHLTSPYQRPALYDRSALSSRLPPPPSPHERQCYIGKRDISGNMKNSMVSSQGAILEPLNQENVDVTQSSPNPIEPLPPNNPIEQQGNQYANFKGPIRTGMQARNFAFLRGDPTKMERIKTDKLWQYPTDPTTQTQRKT